MRLLDKLCDKIVVDSGCQKELYPLPGKVRCRAVFSIWSETMVYFFYLFAFHFLQNRILGCCVEDG